MPKGVLLSCLEKREILNQPAVSVETLLGWGERFLESGMLHDALDFYEKAGAQEPVRRLMELSVEEGDLFLLRRTSKVLKFEPETDRWLELAKAARSRSKLLFAAEAFRQAGVDDDTSQEAPVS